MAGRPVFVGIGAGAIQLGLWAQVAGRRRAKVAVAEVDADKVGRLRRSRGRYTINVARHDRIDRVRAGPVDILNPGNPSDRAALVRALKAATDVVTAVPSTDLYRAGGVAALLREGLAGRLKPVNVYASENRIGAARLLRRLVFPGGAPRPVRFLETVIERMGGVAPCGARDMAAPRGTRGPVRLRRGSSEAGQPARSLAPLTPGSREALLVEEFESIVVEEPRFPGLFDGFRGSRRIGMHEELKLYGHNAVHFLLGCLGRLKGFRRMSDFNRHPELRRIGVDALMLETGGWFRRKYRSSGQSVATDSGYEAWATRLLRRIFNPHLRDPIARVIRDPERKLAWDDRIVGTMRRAVRCGIEPVRYAAGVAAALKIIGARSAEAMWPEAPRAERRRIAGIVERALKTGRGRSGG